MKTIIGGSGSQAGLNDLGIDLLPAPLQIASNK
ncbi:hypothetical protein J2787_000966 [Chryseobacterium rhizosphaerae]|uniref:Uncharacterized protein n=1 Tax=Chryseobacterium rhizosphaerae TaxID=395937 RepID=A0AAE3Y8U3_9FLAO|nr:hypothetical protein [Chryseobacterium rhizosphaerae]